MFNIPNYAKRILEEIEKAGYEAYLVGGCVRDLILGHTPQDWDITSSASPFDIMRIFENSVPTGLKYGTVTVFIGKNSAEVTTFRSEGNYNDFRRPDGVKFETDIKKDLARRDFTVNAMAYSPKRGLVDPFDGQNDITGEIIRTVGNPDERFNEDALRILRAYRFSAQLGFKIESETLAASKKLCGNVSKISPERIKTELDKILLSPRPEKIAEVLGDGALDFLELCKNDRNKDFERLKTIEQDLSCRIAALLYILGENDVKRIANALRFSNKERETVEMLLSQMKMELPKTKQEIKHRLKSGIPPELLKKAFILKADLEDINCDDSERMLNEVISKDEPYNIKMLALNGNDLIKEGIATGKLVGDILNNLLEVVIENPSKNDKKTLLKTAKQMGQFH